MKIAEEEWEIAELGTKMGKTEAVKLTEGSWLEVSVRTKFPIRMLAIAISESETKMVSE